MEGTGSPGPAGEPPAAPRLFGTSGIRQVVGSEITPSFVADIVSAFATWLDRPGPVLVAHDYRTSSDGIARICAGTLQMNGVDVLEMGVLPTPGLEFNVPALGAAAGIMVTASHNPTEFNGLKFVGPEGLELDRLAERAIEEAYARRARRTVAWSGVGQIRAETGGVERYLRSILEHLDRDAILSARPRVVLDCGNGTSSVVVPRLLRLLGLPFTTLNANPDGGFPGHPSEPSEENLTHLRRAVVEFGAQVGIAHDGDSDRVAFVDERGHYVPGDVALALFARDALRSHPGATIATSITSSSAVGDVVRSQGGRLAVSRSGSLAVALLIRNESAVFGGEENGHFYFIEHQNAPDGPMSAGRLLELLARERRPLSEIVAEIPNYSVVKTKIALPAEFKLEVVRAAEAALAQEAVRIDTIDGVKAFFASSSLLIRPSGTEPICRIFAESRDPAEARALADRGRALVNEIVAAHKR